MKGNKEGKVILPGGAGLVGQNLVAQLKLKGYHHIVVLDKHRTNLEILKSLHPDIVAEYADLAEPGAWAKHFDNAEVVVMLQAQIGGTDPQEYVRNNVTATSHILQAIKHAKVPYTVHISSSVVKSMADDHYTRTKKEQEDLVLNSKINCAVLRPTLMFGWFDRKHLGWLSRFMKKMPIFPIPGNGHYLRQPLYVSDFCSIIISCIENRMNNQIFNISGLERIDYIDIIREIKNATQSKTTIIKIPYGLFYVMLKAWALFDKDPPFTAAQLKALVTPDEFEVIDWPGIFKVKATPFNQAIFDTFNHPTYGKVVLEF